MILRRRSDPLCPNCGERITFQRRRYRYLESGMSNVYLTGAQVAECAACGHGEVRLSRLTELHRTVARALVTSPCRLTGEQVRFLRKYLGLNGEQLGRYLHTDKTKVSKWESGQDPVGRASERLIRLLVPSLDESLRDGVEEVARKLPAILDEPGSGWLLQVDTRTLRASFGPAPCEA
ncbi:type II TA system antitoxin MqsA family protein [Paludibaculum fermentans]|uniref:HTH cro/C1-type domain-containing protein n=1 Tax=Paludibaculum fermentans TaxID=1473598 RepID=A0A7S7SMX7_PALFE|nr:type II TA system antitoxin MqsA family protein [Paludibaculum fermentans]QOY89500.1 hypothetical protein IRI77_05990 [Paludibaculum fermentans]